MLITPHENGFDNGEDPAVDKPTPALTSWIAGDLPSDLEINLPFDVKITSYYLQISHLMWIADPFLRDELLQLGNDESSERYGAICKLRSCR